MLPPLGVGISYGFTWLFIATVGYVFIYMESTFGKISPFVLFNVITILSILYTKFEIIETKDLT